MSGNPFDYVGVLLESGRIIIQLLAKYQKKRVTKKELLEVIEEPINKAEKSYRSLIRFLCVVAWLTFSLLYS